MIKNTKYLRILNLRWIITSARPHYTTRARGFTHAARVATHTRARAAHTRTLPAVNCHPVAAAQSESKVSSASPGLHSVAKQTKASRNSSKCPCWTLSVWLGKLSRRYLCVLVSRICAWILARILQTVSGLCFDQIFIIFLIHGTLDTDKEL